MEEVQATYESNRNAYSFGNDGEVVGFLVQDGVYPDVMYVTTGYMERSGNNPTDQWPGYQYIPKMSHREW